MKKTLFNGNTLEVRPSRLTSRRQVVLIRSQNGKKLFKKVFSPIQDVNIEQNIIRISKFWITAEGLVLNDLYRGLEFFPNKHIRATSRKTDFVGVIDALGQEAVPFKYNMIKVIPEVGYKLFSIKSVDGTSSNFSTKTKTVDFNGKIITPKKLY